MIRSILSKIALFTRTKLINAQSGRLLSAVKPSKVKGMVTMNKAVKITATLLVCAALLLPTVLAATQPQPSAEAAANSKTADAREEVVYANLTASGEIENVYVVTILTVNEGGTIVDYGEYTSVKNLTNTDALTLSGDAVSLSASPGDYYYQGTVENAELPWLIDVSYFLDGTETTAEALAGSSGAVALSLSVDPNPNADSSYFDNYMLQISVTLDNTMCRNVSAPDGTIANSGGDKLITFTVMPGTAAELSVEAEVTDFEMAGIEFAALPMSLSIDISETDDLTGDLSSLSDAISELNDAVGELYAGTYDLKTGAEDLTSGSSSFADGLDALNDSSSYLVSGSSEIMNALIAISSSMDGSDGGLDLEALSQLPDTLDELSAGLESITAALTDVNAAFSEAYAALDAAIDEIPDSEISQEALATLYQNNPAQKDTLDQLAAYYAAAATVKGTYEAVKAAFDGVTTAMGQSTEALATISQSLVTISTQLRTSLSENDSASMLLELTSGLEALALNYEDFHSGLVTYTSGVSSLAYNYSQLDGGLGEFADGIDELHDGVGQLADGTTELSEQTQDIPEQIDEQIEALIGDYDKSDFVPVSFVSRQNTNTVSVQFVLMTESIEKAAPEQAAAADDTETETENLWTRFIALFQ